MKVLVTGASGYIGGRLVPVLLDAGHEVRCMTRDPKRLALDPWRTAVEVVAGDALQRDTLDAALRRCDVAYYLIHSMYGRHQFSELDRSAARNFAEAAERTGLGRIIYLGGLGSDQDDLSEHLRSRHEVGRILASGTVPVAELRAAPIIGSGSLSFEMIRHLSELLPVMMKPSWMGTRCQPIAIRNVLQILVAVLEQSFVGVAQIGGPEILTYLDMIQIYADIAGLQRRLVIPLPLYNGWVSAFMVGLVTPLPVRVVKPLIDSLRNDVVAVDPRRFGVELLTYREAVSLALKRANDLAVPTRWSDAVTDPESPMPGDPKWSGAAMEADRRDVACRAAPSDLYWAVSRIGGDVGYYRMNWAWRARGVIDQLVGGVGLRRGRRHPEELHQGESLDFWRVAAIDKDRRLLLRAEMKLPGTAWLEWTIELTPGGSRLVQIARFAPRGVLGRLYWWGLLPLHAPIFGAMARRIAGTAELRWVSEVARMAHRNERPWWIVRRGRM